MRATASGGPDPAALAAIRDGVSGLSILSAERVWSELLRICAAPDPTEAVALMAATGVLAAVLPDGADPAALARLVAAGAPADPLLRFAALSTGEPDAVAARLRLSGAERETLAALRARPAPSPGDDDADLAPGAGGHAGRGADRRAWLAAGPAPAGRPLRTRLAALPRPVFPLEGRDVLALGLREGPRVGELLRAVRQWWLDGGCVADAAACRRNWRGRRGLMAFDAIHYLMA